MRIYDNDTNDISEIIGKKDLTYCESNIIKQLTKQSLPSANPSSADKIKLAAQIKKQCSKAQHTLINEDAKSYKILDDIPRPVYTGAFKKNPDGTIARKTEMCTKIDQMEGRCLPLTYYVPDESGKFDAERKAALVDFKPGDILMDYTPESAAADQKFMDDAFLNGDLGDASGSLLSSGGSNLMRSTINGLTSSANDYLEKNGLPKMVWYKDDFINKYYPNDISTTIVNLDSAWIQPTSQLISGGGYCSKEMRSSGNCLPLGSNYVIPAGKDNVANISVGQTILMQDKITEISYSTESNYFYISPYSYSYKAKILYRKAFNNNIIDIKVGDKNIFYKDIHKYYPATILKNDFNNVKIEYNSIKLTIAKNDIDKLSIQKNIDIPLLEIRPAVPKHKTVTYNNYEYKVTNYNPLTNKYDIKSSYVAPPTITGFFFIIKDGFIIPEKTPKKYTNEQLEKYVIQPTTVEYESDYSSNGFSLNYKKLYGFNYWTYEDSNHIYFLNNGIWYKKSNKTYSNTCSKEDNTYYSTQKNSNTDLFKLNISELKKIQIGKANILKNTDMSVPERETLKALSYIVPVLPATSPATFTVTDNLLLISSVTKLKSKLNSIEKEKSHRNMYIKSVKLETTGLIDKIVKIYTYAKSTSSTKTTKATLRNTYVYMSHSLNNVAKSLLIFNYKRNDKVINMNTKLTDSSEKNNYKIIYITPDKSKVYLKKENVIRCPKFVQKGTVLFLKTVDNKLKTDPKTDPKTGIVIVSKTSNNEKISYYKYNSNVENVDAGDRKDYIVLREEDYSTILALSSTGVQANRYIYMENIPSKRWGNIRGVIPGVMSDVADLISIPLKQLGFDISEMKQTEWQIKDKYIGTSKQTEPTNRYTFLHYLMEREWMLQKIVEEEAAAAVTTTSTPPPGPFTKTLDKFIEKYEKQYKITLEDAKKQIANYKALVTNCKKISGISDYPVTYCARIYYAEQAQDLSKKERDNRGVPVITKEEKLKIGVWRDWETIVGTDAAKKYKDYLNINIAISKFILPIKDLGNRGKYLKVTGGTTVVISKYLSASKGVKGYQLASTRRFAVWSSNKHIIYIKTVGVNKYITTKLNNGKTAYLSWIIEDGAVKKIDSTRRYAIWQTGKTKNVSVAIGRKNIWMDNRGLSYTGGHKKLSNNKKYANWQDKKVGGLNIKQEEADYDYMNKDGYFYHYKENLKNAYKVTGAFKESFSNYNIYGNYKITDLLIYLLIIGFIIYAYIKWIQKR